MSPERNLSDRLSLSPEDVDRVVDTLRARGGEHISRGRGGAGFGYRDGVFYSIQVDECSRVDTPFHDEAAFRAKLAAMDFENNADRYHQSVVRSLGGNPSMDVSNPAMIERGLARQTAVATQQPFSWRGVVHEVRVEADETWVCLTPDGHAPPVWLHLTAAEYAVLRDQGLAGQGLAGRTVVTRGFLRPDAPGPGDVSLASWPEVGLADVTLL
jgi:hypothetical protein